MGTISKIIDETIREGLVPFLKEQGFKKKARTFYREFEERIEVVNVQSSRWNEGDEGRITINLGVYYPGTSEFLDTPKFKGLPKEYDCTVRTRIGLLLPVPCDLWWKIKGAVDSHIAVEQRDAVKEYGLPWFQRMSDMDVVKKLCCNQDSSACHICIL